MERDLSIEELRNRLMKIAGDKRLTSSEGYYATLAYVQATDGIVEKLDRVIFLAEHLFQMIDPQTWRDSGGDDGQGHYEGEYHAVQIRTELEGYRTDLTKRA